MTETLATDMTCIDLPVQTRGDVRLDPASVDAEACQWMATTTLGTERVAAEHYTAIRGALTTSFVRLG
ncbi:MAG: hypothetical protein WCA12_16245, partial [Burkholderiales bacterium]